MFISIKTIHYSQLDTFEILREKHISYYTIQIQFNKQRLGRFMSLNEERKGRTETMKKYWADKRR